MTAVLERPVAVPTRRLRSTQPIPMPRIVGVELQKMFDTRSGFWLVSAVAITAVLATIATIAFAPEEEISYGSFGGAFGIPMAVILPMIAVLTVTSEWSQRSGLTTFTLVPHRGRVITAKFLATLVVGAASIALALAVGAVGNLVGAGIVGIDPVWDISVADALLILLAHTLGMMMGFMLGVLFRNSSGAIVGYFVYALVLPAALGTLAAFQSWFADVQGWIDFQLSSTRLYEGDLASSDWAHLATSGLLWLVLPLAIGLTAVVRSEVK